MAVSRVWFVVSVAVPFVTTLALAITLAHNFATLSVYDEGVHFDYVVKLLTTGRLPHAGDVMSPETLKEISCRGTVWLTKLQCANPITDAQAPLGGINYVLMYGPVYYGLVAAIAGPLHAITGISLLLASRVATGILFSAGAALIAAALLRLRVRPLIVIAVTMLVAATPALLFQGSTVTPDSMCLLAGGAGLFVATLRFSWRTRLLIAAGVALLIALTKPNFVPLASITVLLAAIFPVHETGSSGRAQWFDLGIRRVAAAIALALLPLVAAFGWNAWRTSYLAPGTRADGGLNDMLHTDRSLLSLLSEGVRILTSPFTNGSYTNSGTMLAASTIVQFVFIGGAIALSIVGAAHPRSPRRTLAIFSVAALALTVVYLPVTFYVLYHSTGTQSRYAMPLTPMFAAAVATSLDSRRAVQIILLAAAVLYWIGSLSTVVRL
ncbi:hypothetical protein BH11ACT2_BH11ACT2_08750 [soil metagenome]